ncbi:MAG: MFS transporter [Syntrophomonas sp.]|nr:MFS transporter [Syntrophomonas sp.]
MEKTDTARERATLVAVMSTAFLVPFIGSAVNLALPSLGKEFQSSALLLSWVVTSYLLASAAFLLPFGRLADIVGRRKVFLGGLALFSLFSLLCALTRSIQLLIAFRLLQGIASAMIFSTSMAILTSVFPPNRRGKALGLSVASTYIGLSLGPVLGGWMNHNMGWRSIFYFIAFLSFVVPIYTAANLKGEWKGAEGEKFDLAGSLLYVLGLVAFLYGMSSIASSSWSRYIALLGLALIAFFVRYELRQVHPIIEMRLFVQNITFAFSNLATMINYSATFALGFLMSLYLQVILGHSSQAAGMILLAQPLVMALFSPLAGTLSDRVEPRLVASAGMALSTVGIFFFVFLGVKTPLFLIVANLTLIGLGFALFSSPNTNAVMGSVQPRLYGIASSTLGTMRLVGQALSMALVTLLMAIYIGNAQLSSVNPNNLMQCIHIAFILFSLLCFIGVFASIARGNINEDRKQVVQ